MVRGHERKRTMRHRISGFLAGVAGLASAAFFALSGASCSQPAIQCVAGHGPFFAKYELVSGTGSCAALTGEDIGLSTYLAPNADRTLADYNDRSIAIQSSTVGQVFQDYNGGVDNADKMTPVITTDDKAYGLGKYTTAPDDNNICFAGGFDVGAMSEADVNVPETYFGDDDMGMPITGPAVHLKQSWKNVKVYVTAGVPGTQAVGEMHYEDVIEGCQADYKFVALFPSVYCGEDADGDEMTPDTAQDKLCDPVANPDEGRVFGSGINPDFKTRCDPDLLHCVLTETPLPGNP